jgi:hypothetical protein
MKVPKAGLEPACLATHAPETCVSTNSTTSVKALKKIKPEDLKFTHSVPFKF